MGQQTVQVTRGSGRGWDVETMEGEERVGEDAVTQ